VLAELETMAMSGYAQSLAEGAGLGRQAQYRAAFDLAQTTSANMAFIMHFSCSLISCRIYGQGH
jgi:hypothetical protein